MRNIKLQESLQLSAQWIVQKELQHTLKTKIKGAKLFVVRANLLHPPYIPVSLWFIIIFLVFFYLSKLLFSGFLQFKGNFVRVQNNSKCYDSTPLR